MEWFVYGWMNVFKPVVVGLLVVLLAIVVGNAQQPQTSNYEKHGLKRLVDRVIYKENGEYKGSIPNMQSVSESGFKTASICKVASSTLNAFYKRDLNEVAEYYSNLFAEIYIMSLDTRISVADAAAKLYRDGHSEKTVRWAGQRMSLIRSTMVLLHGDLNMLGPEGMPRFARNPANAKLSGAEFAGFMVDVKAKAQSSKSLTTQMAAALASSPSQLNGLVEKSSFLIKDKIAGLLADPAGGDAAVPEEMRTHANYFNPQNVGDLYLALGVMALHIQNPQPLVSAGVKPSPNVLNAMNFAKTSFLADDEAAIARIGQTQAGTAKWESAPLGPAKVE